MWDDHAPERTAPSMWPAEGIPPHGRPLRTALVEHDTVEGGPRGVDVDLQFANPWQHQVSGGPATTVEGLLVIEVEQDRDAVVQYRP